MITLLHPSRGRAVKAKETYDNWMKKSSGIIPIEHVLSIDVDDDQNQLYIQLFNGDTKIISDHHKNLVDATNNGAWVATGDIIVLLSDDFDCPQDWDKDISLAFVGRKGYVLKTFDGTQGWIVTLPIMDRTYYEQQGYFYHPDYKHMFCDTDMTHKAELEGRLILRNDLIFPHNHYSTGAMKKDAVSEKADLTWDQGQAFYLKRVSESFGLQNVDVLNLCDAAKPHINWLKQRMQ
jgi:hypothetical protein